MNTKAFFLCWEGSNLILGTGKENQIFILRTPATIKLFHQILKKFWCLKKSLPTQIDLYDPYMVPHTISWGNYYFPRSTNKIQFFDKISTSVKKIVYFMKDLKHEHQSTFPLWGRVKLNLRDRYRKLNVFSKNSSRYQLFSSNSQKLSLWCKKLSLPTHMDLYDPYMVLYNIPQGYYNFPRSTNKIPFFDKISTSGRICQLNEGLKI